MKSQFSEPKIFTGGVAISQWSKLSKEEQKKALAKNWYVYYSYRDPQTNILIRQPNIKAGVNKFKTKRDRYAALKILQRCVQLLLEKGFSPYQDNSELRAKYFPNPENDEGIIKSDSARPVAETITITDENIVIPVVTVKEAFELAVKIKKSVLSKTSFPNFQSNVRRFEKWLHENGFEQQSIEAIDKKTVIAYLNIVLQSTSARTRNNTRIDLSSLFQTLEDNEMLK